MVITAASEQVSQSYLERLPTFYIQERWPHTRDVAKDPKDGTYESW
jgi:hypothetical protein